MRWSAARIRSLAERVRAARLAALEEGPGSGTTGLELEWNLLDDRFRPLQQVGAGPGQQSFADVFRNDLLPPWLSERTQLEVFHWMMEWTTRPQPSPWLTIAEARILEACQANALHQAGLHFQEPLHAWHGNLLTRVRVDHTSIPGGWNLAKRRYLERCVDLYGARLATAGIHVNLTLPEPLLAWDFLHQAQGQRTGHFDGFKNRVYIDLTRRMRPFASLFIATSASTPMRPVLRRGRSIVRLTQDDSVRTLTFPSPEALDVPGLYRSHAQYLRLSYDLVRRGLRFGNNNWTPVRARSFAEPVERLISLNAEQLEGLYRQGLYAGGSDDPVEPMVQRAIQQNLFARIDLPMARVELRTDEGGHPFDLDVANLALKELLLLRLYADHAFAREATDDAAGIGRLRLNERLAAQRGLRAGIEDPFAVGTIEMRAFLMRTLDAVEPLAEALGTAEWLAPLQALARGEPNTAEGLREAIRRVIGGESEVPAEVLTDLARQRVAQVGADLERIAEQLPALGTEADRLRDLWDRARDLVHQQPGAPVRFRPAGAASIQVGHRDKTAEIIDLAQALIRIPSVSGASPERQRPEAIRRAATLLVDTLELGGLNVCTYDAGRFPAILARFPGVPSPPMLLVGHFDVVEPDPDDSQFEPRVDGDYLWGRGAADMKTVVATFAVWMRDSQSSGQAPPLGLLLVGNEEIGENEPEGTPHVLGALRAENGYEPHLLVAGERTGEHGDELFGEVCLENRGLLRLEFEMRGSRAHTGFGAAGDLDTRLLRLRESLLETLQPRLTRAGQGGWSSQLAFPFQRVGQPGLFNITADRAVLGVEVRPIPADRLESILAAGQAAAVEHGASMRIIAAEDGVACDPADPWAACLLRAVRETAAGEPRLGRKLAATSARFAPQGRGIVWGQSGIGPHAPEERHFIPSIEPYYRALHALARIGAEVAPGEAAGPGPMERPPAGGRRPTVRLVGSDT